MRHSNLQALCDRLIWLAVSAIDVINVEMKIKKTLKNVKNVEKIKCKRWIKTLPTFATNPTIIFAH